MLRAVEHFGDAPTRSDEDRMDDQTEFVEQAGVEEARDQCRATDDVDRAEIGVLEPAEFLDRADDSCAWPGDVREGGGEHQVLGSCRNLRVGDLARIGIATEHLGCGRRVLEYRRPELLVSREHPGAENEPVHRRQQLEPVRPRVDPVRAAVRVEDPAVERHLQDGDQVS